MKLLVVIAKKPLTQLLQLWTNLPLTKKLVSLLFSAAFFPLLVAMFLATSTATQLLKTEINYELNAMRELKSHAIERYFDTAEKQVVTLAQNGMLINGIDTLKDAFMHMLDEDGIENLDNKMIDNSLYDYYHNSFGKRYSDINEGKSINTDALLNNLSPTSKLLQYRYISDNAHPLGEKDSLNKAKGKSSYHDFHQVLHPTLRTFLKKFGYYDIFLVDDKTGYIIYSVFKELDYATSLIDGPYANTGIGEVFNKAKHLAAGEYAMSDYALYPPSYDAPASFIASPIFDQGKRSGVLIFQMPLEPINDIMHDRSGLGESGQSYLIGSDGLMRSDAFINADQYSVAASFHQSSDSIKKTPAMLAAIDGKSGYSLEKNYADIEMLTAYGPLNIAGYRWGILVEKASDEALAPVSSMIWKMTIFTVIGLALLLPAAIYIGRSLSHPIEELAKTISYATSSGDFSKHINNVNKDEVGQTSQAFDQLMSLLSKAFGETNRVLRALSNGNYNTTISGHYPGDIGALANGVNETVQQLDEAEQEKQKAQQQQLLEAKAREDEAIQREDDAKQREMEAVNTAISNGRIKQALDSVNGNVMIADDNYTIIYANSAIMAMLSTAEADIKKDLPAFSVQKLLGSNIDIFHSNPQHQRQMLNQLSSSHELSVSIGGRSFKLTANPIFSEQRERIGTVMEWEDRTAEVAIEQEIDCIVQAGSNGDFSQQLALQGKAGFFLSLSTGLNSMLTTIDNCVKDLQQMFSGLANGSLSARVTGDYHGAFAELKTNANKTAEQLAMITDSIRRSADQMSIASSELAAGNNDLSRRTEQQAASLEEASSGMTEMTDAVKTSNDNVQLVRQQTAEAQQSAQAGGNKVNEAISAMSSISAASNKISDIIGVINDIAFQTNLLALNAAVEAARAGDQGRGFAVVASEVRSLAQRSASAAKEIKLLIQDSVDKVNSGTALVNESGETLNDIVSAIDQVNKSIQDIAESTQEQNDSIGQLNSTVSYIDQITQENAAMVEEATAASRSMADNAQSLKELIAFFK